MNRNEEINGAFVSFNEKDHAYIVDGQPVVSVTQLLKEQGIAGDFSHADPNNLAMLASRGSLIHEEVETYIKTGQLGFSDELQQFIRIANPIADWQSEVMTFYSETINNIDTPLYAGRVDLIGKSKKDGHTIIADIKTGTVNKEAVAWQLSLYLIALHEQGQLEDSSNVELMAIDLKPDYCVCETVQMVNATDIDRLLQCHFNGAKFSDTQKDNSLIICAEDEEKALMFESKIAELEAIKKEYDNFKARLKEELINNKISEYKGQRITIKVSEYDTTRLDTTALKKEKPEIYEQYAKTTQCSRMTVKVVA